MGKTPNIDFRFAKNWRAFLKWYELQYKKANCAPMWDVQELKIETFFSAETKGIVDWKSLWKEFRTWYKDIYNKKGNVIWNEQKRQIETLMLEQLKELNKEQFVLVYLHFGKPEVDTTKMSYWECLRVKDDLGGNKDGVGGNEDMERITIVNLNKLIQ